MNQGDATQSRAEEFRKEREHLNQLVLEHGDLTAKRFFSLDTQAYAAGALSVKSKELMGLVASLVLRCDDCILYHLIRCCEEGITDEEFSETMSIGLVVGGSITIPHIRRAYREWTKLRDDSKDQTRGR